MTDIFNRQEELARLRQRFDDRKSLLLHGPAGVGKTLLLRSLLPCYPEALYCAAAASPQALFKSLAERLVARHDAEVARIYKRRVSDLLSMSAVSQKGVVLDALRAGKHIIVLDHLNRPSATFAAAVREILYRAPVIAVSRSEHMEDAGLVGPLLPDRSERMAVRNLDPESAKRFACIVCSRLGLEAGNMVNVLQNTVTSSEGNPGAIVRLLEMARLAKYRSGDHIKWSPLYIDFRMELASSNAR
jgi:hypothetical protein